MAAVGAWTPRCVGEGGRGQEGQHRGSCTAPHGGWQCKVARRRVCFATFVPAVRARAGEPPREAGAAQVSLAAWLAPAHHASTHARQSSAHPSFPASTLPHASLHPRSPPARKLTGSHAPGLRLHACACCAFPQVRAAAQLRRVCAQAGGHGGRLERQHGQRGPGHGRGKRRRRRPAGDSLPPSLLAVVVVAAAACAHEPNACASACVHRAGGGGR